ncbi:hypothetical protein [Streptomyces sp. H27-C3]|uniref:hypothetical protein n=1 Tax=Streptomyces sp. H27-C3 TaxID=3046305 RepID=UPI0024BBC3FC|nr:hypothetical protein [Streptomyces sp. H27-C3]MDJ0460211.1 hypothetical protein [Streptomyces sp. H27-C3]
MADAGPRCRGSRRGAYDHHTSMPECFGFHQYRPEAEAEIRRRAGDEVRAALDERSYEHAYARGADLSLQEAGAGVTRTPPPGDNAGTPGVGLGHA